MLVPAAIWLGFALLGQADSTSNTRGLQHFDHAWLHQWARDMEANSHVDSFDGTGLKLEGVYTMDSPAHRADTLAHFNLTEAQVDGGKSLYEVPRLHSRYLLPRAPAPGDCGGVSCGSQPLVFQSKTEQQYMSGKECDFVDQIATGTASAVGFVFSNAGCYAIQGEASKEVCKFLIEVSTAMGGYYIGQAVKNDCIDHMIAINNACRVHGGSVTCTEPTGSAFEFRKFIYSANQGNLCEPTGATKCQTMACTNGDCKGGDSP